MYIFQQIEDLIYDKGGARQQVGSFLLEHKDQLADMTMEQIAKASYTSKPTLVRFAKSLGFSGWKEFIYAFSHETAQLEASDFFDVDYNYPISRGDDSLQIIEKIANLHLLSVKETVNLLAPEDLQKASQLLAEASQIVIFGTSPNNYYGETFKRKLLAIGKQVVVADLGEWGLLARNMKPSDCALIISYSGNILEREPFSNLKLLFRRKIPTLALTSEGDNFLRRQAQVCLSISSRERLYSKVANFASEESIMLLLNLLYAQLFALDYDQNMSDKMAHSTALERARHSQNKQLEEAGD